METNVKNNLGKEDIAKNELDRKKSNKKNLIVILVNFVLAAISVYAFEFWFKSLQNLETLQVIENIAAVGLTALTYFVGKTYYTKGVINNIKKILLLVFLAVLVLALMLLSVHTYKDMIYPFSGMVVVSIAFYMLSLTTGTLTTIGIVGMGLFFAIPISFLKWFDKISWNTVGELSELAVFAILFFGGTWAQIRAYIHGIRGVNKDSGGFGASDTDDNSGDYGDGDGDMGDEE